MEEGLFRTFGAVRRGIHADHAQCAESSGITRPSKPLSARTIARLLTSQSDRLSTADARLAAI
jgi:hypothetical protein